MKNDRAYPCDTLIITTVNGNNEESGKVFKNKVFTWMKLKIFKHFNYKQKTVELIIRIFKKFDSSFSLYLYFRL